MLCIAVASELQVVGQLGQGAGGEECASGNTS